MTNTKGATTTKASAKDKLMEFIIDGIEKNERLPWDNGRLNGNRTAINRVSGKKYRGINRLLLNQISSVLKDPSQEWVTFKQAKDLGGSVKKGEHGFPVVFYSLWDKERRCAADKDSDKENVVPFLRTSTVFDLCQCEGIETRRKYETIEHPHLTEVDALIEKFAVETKLKLELEKQADTAFYSPIMHKVSVAGLQYHKTAEEYYSTLFHEVIHSTAKAMKRKTGTAFGDEKYSEEEIVAECGAMLLCMEFGITKTARDNSVTYLKCWSNHLKENKDWLLRGMSNAEKAVEYIFEKIGYEPQVL